MKPDTLLALTASVDYTFNPFSEFLRSCCDRLNPSFDLFGAKEVKYDQRIAKILIRRYRIPKDYKQRMLKLNERQCGQRTFALWAFMHLFPSFPIQLQVMKLRDLRKCYVSDLFANFGNTEMVKCYEQAWREGFVGDPNKPFGLVIEWAHTNSGGGLVLHNHPIDVRVLGSRRLWIGEHGQLVLEPLNVLLDTIDSEVPGHKGWQPESSEEEVIAFQS